MVCFECGGKLYVKDSVNVPGNIIYRQKICKNCGQIYYTMERNIANTTAFQKDWARYHRLYNIERGESDDR